MTEFVFDWQKNRDNFIGWMFVNLMTPNMPHMGGEDNWVSKMSDLTDEFTNVRMQVTINGVEVDTKEFVESLERSLDLTAKDEAARMLSELGPLAQLRRFAADLEAKLESYDQAIGQHVTAVVSEVGIEMDEWEKSW